MPTVIVAGLGPAGSDLVPPRTRDLAAERRCFLRTRHHPAADVFPDADDFDALYDTAEDLGAVYVGIVDHLVAVACTEGTVVYLVPGSPLVAEHTVVLLREHAEVEVLLEPAMSFLDLAWARLGVDPLAVGVSLVDGHRFEEEVEGRDGPLLVGQCDDRFVLSDIKLAVDADEPPPVTVLQRLGLPDEACFDVEWHELDRSFEPDHLTSIWIPWLPARPGGALAALHRVVVRLRAECPWDRDQTHQSLAKYAVEEATEVGEAIAALDAVDPTDDQVADLVSELGDLLFQVMIHAAIGEESGDFTFVDVARAITEKMVRRHPHVFDRPDGAPELTMAELSERWEQIKAAERAERHR